MKGRQVFLVPGPSGHRKEHRLRDTRQRTVPNVLSGTKSDKNHAGSVSPVTHFRLDTGSGSVAKGTYLRPEGQGPEGLSQAHTACDTWGRNLHGAAGSTLLTVFRAHSSAKSPAGKTRQQV